MLPAAWPKVPACYGWLSLTRRGEWRLGDGVVRHDGLVDFINRHYVPDQDGLFCVHNGPQKVYVSMDYTPWIWRLAGQELQAHPGGAAGMPDGAWIDEEGSLLLRTPLGIGCLDDRDLPSMLPMLRDENGLPLSDEAFEALLLGRPSGCSYLHWQGTAIPLATIYQAEVAATFGFNPAPQAPPLA